MPGGAGRQDELTEGVRLALTMPAAEQARRMRAMREQVLGHNVYRWAGKLLGEAVRLLGPPAPPALPATRHHPNGAMSCS